VIGLFWGAALKKVPQGAWVPLMIGVILCAIYLHCFSFLGLIHLLHRMILMTFWTWAKGLEDAFDGANRRNLRHFIYVNDKAAEAQPVTYALTHLGNDEDIISEEDEPAAADKSQETTYYFLTTPSEMAMTMDNKKLEQEKKELVRLPTCAIFHKLAKGKGVPHTFVGEQVLYILALVFPLTYII
jgi:KUP system potassium uptake protein